MYDTIAILLLNFLFLCFFLLFIPLITDTELSRMAHENRNVIYIICAALAIISCISFPIQIMDGFMFDLRLVATMVGSLYGGVLASIFLFIVGISYRLVFGGLGALSSIFVSMVIMIIAILLYSRFNEKSKRRKLIIISAFSLFTGFFVLTTLTFINGLILDPKVTFIYISIQWMAAVVIVYITEFIREASLIRSKVVKAEKMEVVRHLASSISHEVRNPLTVVRGFLQMMIQNDLNKEKREEFLKISMAEIDRANVIIRDYLTFAKPKPENMEKFDVKEELSHLKDLLSPLANMNSITIETELHSFKIEGERQLFQQCLLNIAKNCIEAMPESGVLTIKVMNEIHKVNIEVSDTGMGMSEEQIARIGEPYFTTKGRNGTGLGMLSAIRIVETMKGTMKISSELNKGTTFIITFPYAS
ncbi:sensor histidine kinase [Alkalihalobacillus deserti]|uniref:sensor histidine kinase n=1 Tax=Alkalihalobacillus deserti TaxID=2879466 RepID=UPI001D15B0AD|nr:HAMP domain-containing sensor histidine kinase [Alkalihalobacillus deserti]